MAKELEEAIKEIKTYMHDYIMESFDDDGYTRYEISEEEQEFFNNIDKLLNLLKENDKRINGLEFALLDMVMQFADRPNIKGSRYALDTMGLSALELAFSELGFDNPYPVNKAEEKYKILAKQYYERKLEDECKR